MKNILLFGAGKSATVLIDYLLKNAEKEQWHLMLADANRSMSQEKIGGSVFGTAVTIDIANEGL
jgi:saccharopine dehydrogenase-like NADP-dependent oxidoreductase